MRKFLTLLIWLALSASAFAQTIKCHSALTNAQFTAPSCIASGDIIVAIGGFTTADSCDTSTGWTSISGCSAQTTDANTQGIVGCIYTAQPGDTSSSTWNLTGNHLAAGIMIDFGTTALASGATCTAAHVNSTSSTTTITAPSITPANAGYLISSWAIPFNGTPFSGFPGDETLINNDQQNTQMANAGKSVAATLIAAETATAPAANLSQVGLSLAIKASTVTGRIGYNFP